MNGKTTALALQVPVPGHLGTYYYIPLGST